MVPVDIRKIQGYSEVSNLIPEGHLLCYKQVWSINYKHYLDAAGELQSQLTLELTTNRDAYDEPTIKLVMVNPRQMKLFPSLDIIQLSIDDYKVDGWESGNYHVYDAEMDTEWEIFCERIVFKRGTQIPQFIT